LIVIFEGTSTFKASASGSDTERKSHPGDEFIERTVTLPPTTESDNGYSLCLIRPASFGIISLLYGDPYRYRRETRVSLGMDTVSRMGARDTTNADLAVSRTIPTGQPLPQEFKQDSVSLFVLRVIFLLTTGNR